MQDGREEFVARLRAIPWLAAKKFSSQPLTAVRCVDTMLPSVERRSSVVVVES